jgi:hypothetical protein
MKNYKTAVAMKCNQEQFESVRGQLEKLGYEVKNYVTGDGNPLDCITNTYQKLGIVSNIAYGDGTYFCQDGIDIFPTWNSDLFLALAAMVEGDVISEGEWFYNDRENVFKPYAECCFGESADNKNFQPKATAEQLIEYFTKQDELLKLSEVEEPEIGKRYLIKNGDIVECVECVGHKFVNNICASCCFKHNDDNCTLVSCSKEDREDGTSVVFKLVEKSQTEVYKQKIEGLNCIVCGGEYVKVEQPAPETITFKSKWEMIEFVHKNNLFTKDGCQYYWDNNYNNPFRFAKDSNAECVGVKEWDDYVDTFYLSDPTVKPKINLTLDEARHLIAQMKQVEFEQITIK